MSDLPAGWTEAYEGGMAINPDPINGGIIDKEFVSGKWFVIMGPDGHEICRDGFATREEAFAAFFAGV